jgi:hypothetical protein
VIGNAAPIFDPAAERQALRNYTLRQVEFAKQFLEIAATDHPLAERMLSAPPVQQSWLNLVDRPLVTSTNGAR